MSLLRALPRRLHPLTSRRLRAVDRDIRDEIQAHLEMRTEDNLARGLSPAEARAEALRRFGDVRAIANACTEARLGAPLRLALRATETGVVLAVGLGLVAAVLLMINGVLFRPPAGFQGGAQRVAVWWVDGEGELSSGSTLEEFRRFGALDDVFEHVTLARYQRVNVDAAGAPLEEVRAKYVSPRYFDLYGARPLLGRAFSADEDARALPVTVLSHRFWQRRFGADPTIVGRSIHVNGRPHTVVGVMPANVNMYLETALFVPLSIPFPEAGGRNSLIAAQLRPGIPFETARARVGAALASVRPDNVAGRWHGSLRALEDVYTAGVPPRLFSELTLVGLLLFALLLHVVNRCLSALSPHVLPRRALLRSVGAAWVSAGIGLLLARGAAAVLTESVIGPLNPLFDVRVDGRVVALTLALATVAGLTIGLAAWGARVAARGRAPRFSETRRRWVRRALVTVELSLASILLCCAALPASSLLRSGVSSPGFETRGIETIDVGLSQYGGASRVDALDGLLQRVRAVRGVEAAGLTHAFPAQGRHSINSYRRADRPGEPLRAASTIVDPDYTGLMGIRLVAGRRLGPEDTARTRAAAVVNRAFAESISPGSSPIGMLLDHEGGRVEVVGVVANVRETPGLRGPQPILYRPYTQCPGYGGVTLVVRGDGGVGARVARALRAYAPTSPIGDPVAADAVMRASQEARRFRAAWLGFLAALALAFAMADLAGLILDGAERRPRVDRRVAHPRVRELAGPALRVSAASLAFAALAVWRLGRLDWPTLGALRWVDLPMAAGVALILLLATGAVVGAVGWYARSQPA